MPEKIRSTVEGPGARPQRGGFRSAGIAIVAAIVAAMGAPFETALAQPGTPAFEGSTLKAYLSALLLLDRHEIAALALTLGILSFAVVTAILLVRTRRRLAAATAAAHDQAIAARSAIDRAYALLLSEPQVLIAWPATAEDPEIDRGSDPGSRPFRSKTSSRLTPGSRPRRHTQCSVRSMRCAHAA